MKRKNDNEIERNCIAAASIKSEKNGFWNKMKRTAEKIVSKLGRKKIYGICTAVFALSLLIVFNMNFSFAYNAFLGGVELGYVPDGDYVQMCMDSINGEFSRYVSGEDIVGGTVVYVPSVIRKDKFTAEDILKENIKSTSDVMVKAYAVVVDGAAYSAMDTESDAEAVLKEIADEYKTDGVSKTSFKENVMVVYEYVPASILLEPQLAKLRLQGYKTVYNTVCVDKRITAEELAVANNMELEYFKSLNPNVGDEIQAGDSVVIPKAEPVITVLSDETVTYSEEIPFEENVTEDANLYEGINRIVRQGENGTAEITERIERENGEIVSQTVMKSVITEKPVVQLRTVGTKYRPENVGTGDFIRPYSGTVSSRFGARSSGNHTGVDFCGNVGDSIVAADSGTVIFSGWSGGYGNIIKIDHNNGYVTYYAHCSELYANVGDVVQKGDVIAAVGSTGNSTGPHVHFEIRYGGDYLDPLGYVEE